MDSDSKLKKFIYLGAGGALVLFIALSAAVNQTLVALLISALILVLIILSAAPTLGLYLMALALPLINWNFTLGSFQFSIIEALAVLTLVAYGLRLILQFLKAPRILKEISWPVFWPLLIFVSVAFLSGFLAPDNLTATWYTCRWILFFALAYLWLPYNIIKDGAILKKTLVCLSISGTLVALMGLISLYFQDWSNAFFRIQPLAIAGIYPIGDNHNLIAEYLVIISFFVLALKHWVKDVYGRRAIDVWFIFLVLITLGTFSRTAWIVLAIQISLYFAIENFVIKKRILDVSKLILGGLIILLIVTPFTFQMTRLQSENSSSTASRYLLMEIALDTFGNYPWLGAGTGRFVEIVNDNVRYRANFGDALDSHGFGQKILAENGLLGILAWLFLLLAILRLIWLALKKYQAEVYLLLPLFIGVLGGFIYQAFNTSYYKGKLWLPVALALVAVRLLDLKYARRQKQN